jgi:hypothetical protein
MTEPVNLKQLSGDIVADQAARYAAARRVADEEGIRIKHFRPLVLDTPEGDAFLHQGGITVAYRKLSTDSFIEVSTALCSHHDTYNRKVGTLLAVEQFANLRRIRVPVFDLTPEEAVDSLFGSHLTFVAETLH